MNLDVLRARANMGSEIAILAQPWQPELKQVNSVMPPGTTRIKRMGGNQLGIDTC